jgi:predicted MFS family arabinose efflux permease
LISSIYLSGCCFGAIIFSCFAYKFGRKELFNVTLIIYFFSVILISISPNYTFFAICRFFTGIAVGGEYTAIFAAVDELIPPNVRGRVDIILDGTW